MADDLQQITTSSYNRSDPIPVQVVLQGGGAKLVALIAVLEVLEKFVNDKKIKINMLAGTSAGSIAACMLASGLPVSSFRNTLIANGETTLRQIFLRKGKWRTRWAMIMGNPILSEEELRSILNKLFRSESGTIERFGQLKVPTIVISTNLRNTERFRHGQAETEQIVDAIASSCAIPFAFRTYKNKDLPIDGGICANLPALELFDGQKKNGNIIGFSFTNDEDKVYPDSFEKYCQSLLFTAMNNSVRDACDSIQRSGGEVYLISTKIGTFDFRKALEELKGGEGYKLIKKDVETWLNGRLRAWHAASPKGADIKPEVISKDDLMHRVSNVYDFMIKDCSFNIVRGAMVITANCLRAKYDKSSENMDEIEQRTDLMPTIGPLRCFRTALLATGATPVLGQTEWVLTDKQGSRRDFTVIPVMRAGDVGEDDERMHHAIFFFHPPLEPENGPYKLIQIDWRSNTMGGLQTQQRCDWAWLTSSHAQRFEVADIVVRLPKTFPKVLASDLGQRLEEIPENRRPRKVNGEPVTWAVGQQMTDEELLAYPQRGGFQPVGWRAKNMLKEQHLGMLIRRAPDG